MNTYLEVETKKKQIQQSGSNNNVGILNDKTTKVKFVLYILQNQQTLIIQDAQKNLKKDLFIKC